ncbi:SDR family oxidoreductase [Pseudomaricurvus alcaniphilus]|uniref:SDR family oxidoreductase n=1 Tax=Pseudomaricurvus alcaniphilus TaxID=1166482 RepID=UPI00140C4B74|nr:SDR family oxidoreductase [Pseudomaricurvus alcaniphilus]NHN39867.1 SDR family oxidoreductase [Pseudomaricurvus alcaniphilus]
MNKLDKKVVMITGAADGIGAAAGRALALAGATIVATDINLDGAKALAASLGNNAIAMSLDVCDENAWQSVINKVMQDFGKLDILVNNAGGAGAGTIEDISIADYRNAMRLNADSVFIGSKLAIEVMKGTGGNIINVASIHGIRAAAHAASYTAAKGAVRLLTKSVALHCAQHGYNIRCNSIHPGYVLTTQMLDWLDKQEDPAAAREQLVALHPIGYLAEPEDIANGILFLASEDSRFMTGSELVMDGGFELV